MTTTNFTRRLCLSYPTSLPLIKGRLSISLRPHLGDHFVQVSRANSTRNDPDATFFHEARKIATNMKVRKDPLITAAGVSSAMFNLVARELQDGQSSFKRSLLSIREKIDNDAQQHKSTLNDEERKLLMDVWRFYYRVTTGLFLLVQIGGFSLAIWLANRVLGPRF